MLKPAGRYECAYCRWHIADCQCTGLYRRERSARVFQAIQAWMLVLFLAEERVSAEQVAYIAERHPEWGL